MRKYLSFIVAILIVTLYIINYDTLFDYAKGVDMSDFDSESYGTDLSVLEDNPFTEDKLSERPSITHLMVASGSMGSTPMRFNEPNEFEELSDEDNQKIFFFGKLDDDIIEPSLEDTQSALEEGGWDYWGGDEQPYPTPAVEEEPKIDSSSEVNEGVDEEVNDLEMEPIEVTLDAFIGK